MADEDPDDDDAQESGGSAAAPSEGSSWLPSWLTGSSASEAPALPPGFKPWQPNAAASSSQPLPPGFKPWQPADQPADPDAPGPIGTFLRHTAHAVLPSASAVAGAETGAAIGAAVGAPFGGVGAGPGGLIGGVIGGIGGYMLGSKVQEEGLKAVGADDSVALAVGEKLNPKTALAGDIAGSLPFFGVGAASRLVRGAGAAFGTGMEAIKQYQGDEGFDPIRLGMAGAAGATLVKPTAAAEAISGAAARLVGRTTPMIHGTPGAKAAAGTAEEQVATEGVGDQPANDEHNAKVPPVEEQTVPPAEQTRTGDTTLDAGLQASLQPEPPAEPAAPPPAAAEAAGAAQPAPTANLDSTIERLRDERDATPVGPLRRALEVATSTGLDNGQIAQAHEWAIANGRRDIAEALTQTSERAGETMGVTPGVPEGHPKYEEISKTLQGTKSRQQAVAAELRRRLEAAQQAGQAPAPEPIAVEPGNPRVQGDLHIEPNPDGPGHVLMRGDETIGEPHPNLGQAFMAMNREAKAAEAAARPAESVSQEPAPPVDLRQRISDAETAPNPVAHLRETAAMARAQGQEGRARQIEQGADAVERSQQRQQQQRQPQQQQQQQQQQPGGGRVPPEGPPVQRPSSKKPAEPELTPKEALAKATTMHDALDGLRRNRDADLPALENDIKAAQQKAGMETPGILSRLYRRFAPPRDAVSEREMYRSEEDQNRSKLPQQQRDYMGELEKTWDPEAKAARARLAELGVANQVSGDREGGFIRRLVKGYQGDANPMVGDEPLGTSRGGKSSTLKSQVFHGMTAADGMHQVIRETPEGNLAVLRKGQPEVEIANPHEGSLPELHGKKITYDGKEYTIGLTKAREITDRLPDMQYHESYTTARASEMLQLREAVRQAELFHDFKTNDAKWGDIRSTTPKPGWVRPEVPGLSHMYMDPQMAQAFDRVYKMDPHSDNWLAKLNDIAVSSIFLNPIPHSLNEAYHWVVGRGEDWLKPSGYYNLFKSGEQAITAVLSKNQDYVDALRARGPMVEAGRARSDAIFRIAQLAEYDGLKRNPHPWDIIAKKFGMGPSQLFREIFNASSTAMWTAGDVMRLQRMYELQLQGMTKEESLREMIRHQPDYRLPLQVMGSSQFADFLANQRMALMFTRYHYKVFGSLADMAKNAISPSASAEERRKAIGHLMVLGLMAYVAKPLLDNVAQKITGNKDAEIRPRGPLAPLYMAHDYYAGKTDFGKALSSAITLAPPARLAIDALTNRDFAGRQIINPAARLPEQITEGVEHLAGNIISPYATFGGTLQPGSAKGSFGEEVRNQLLDIKAPTARQVKGQKFGVTQAKKDLRTREKRPRGLIEYGYQQLRRGTGYAEGGPVEAEQPAAPAPAQDDSYDVRLNLLDQARQQYPVLRNQDYGYTENLTPNKAAGYLEHWAPGEEGDTSGTGGPLDVPRPSQLPLDKPGLEIRNPQTRVIDVLGDVVSHNLVNTDPVVKQTYNDFQGSLTSQQQQLLQKQYAYAQKNEGEKGAFDDWRQRSGMPGLFRGYTFDQWPKDFTNKVYTPQQKQKLDSMMQYLRGQRYGP